MISTINFSNNFHLRNIFSIKKKNSLENPKPLMQLPKESEKFM